MAKKTNVKAGVLHHEVHVSFGARHDNVHPDTHGLRRRSHHVVHTIMGLHTESQRRIGALVCGGGWGFGNIWREEERGIGVRKEEDKQM